MTIEIDVMTVAELQRRICRMVSTLQSTHIETLRVIERAIRENRSLDSREKAIVKKVTNILNDDVESALKSIASEYSHGG